MRISNLIFALFIGLTACGPSAREKEAALERARQDSITAFEEASKPSASQNAFQNINDSIGNKPTLAHNIDFITKTPSDKKFIKTADLKFRVTNVLNATERIENLAAKYNGFITYSNLENVYKNSKTCQITRGLNLNSSQYVVVNEIHLRVPNERLDLFINELKSLVVFLDYRIFKLTDVTFELLANQKITERLGNYEKRETQHIDTKGKKLKETTIAEDILLYRQNQADYAQVQKLLLEDKLKYCDLIINIYQDPVIVKQVVENFKYVSNAKPNFFVRIWDSIVQGWWILEEIIIFLFKVWGILLFIVVIISTIVFLKKWLTKK
jgi:hypothetical protein